MIGRTNAHTVRSDSYGSFGMNGDANKGRLSTGRCKGGKLLQDGPQAVPQFLRASLYGLLLVAAASSVPMVGAYGPLPTTVLLDVWVTAFLVMTVFRGRTQAYVAVLLLAAYAYTRILAAFAASAPVEDFLQAYRWVYYLLVLCSAIGRSWGPIRPLAMTTWALISMALFKAVLTFLLRGAGERPGLLLENNFELALFSGLVLVIYPYLRHRALLVVMMGALTFLSGSRSGAIAFLVLLLFAFSQVRSRSLLIRYLAVCAVPVAALFPLVIFSERASVDSRVDRLNFFNVFLADVSSFSPIQWIFGTTPITPLSPAACHQLAFYRRLFSSAEDGTCYSVILHAFVLRVTFDAGIFGLILAFGVVWWALRRSGVRLAMVVALFGIALTNSLSVSGINNPYVVLPLLLAILTAPGVSLARRLSSEESLQ